MEKVFGLNYNSKILIGEHEINLKPAPKKKDEILFYNFKTENAFWDRNKIIKDYPEIWFKFVPYKTLIDTDATLYNQDGTELLQLSKDDSDIIRKLYRREIDRRLNGVFFRNGDELEYLTGSNYFTLLWCKMFGNTRNEGYGLFYKYQRDVFYLLDYIWTDPNILGIYLSKAKKTGITQIIDGGYCVDLATRKEEWLIGFMSRSQEVAIENNMKLFLYAFENLPASLKPKVGFKAAKGGNIEFTERGKVSGTKQATDVLNTRVFCAPTAEHSFDSHFMNIVRLDEFPKYWQDSKQEPKEVLTGNKAGVKDQDEFRGRVIISSYPPEVDDIGSKQGEEVYYSSKLSTKKYGKTESELICYHIPAYQSLKSCIDKYGNCDEKKASQIISENIERIKKDKKAVLAYIRQNPNSEREAFGSNSASSCFDSVYLADVLFDLEEEIRYAAKPLYAAAKLVWDNPMWETGKRDARPPGVFTTVSLVPATEQELLDGVAFPLKNFQTIPLEDRNVPLRTGRDELGNILAPLRFKYFVGNDPVSYTNEDDVDSPSMQSIYVMNMHDEDKNYRFRELVTKIIISEYNFRQPLAQASYEDVVKMIIYYGGLIAVEANSPLTYTRLKNEGLGNYLIVKHKDGYFRRWGVDLEDNDYKGIIRSKNASQNELMETLVELIKHYIFKPEEGQNEYARTIKSIKLLQQLIKFDPFKTRKFDTVMGFGYCLLAYNVYQNELNSNINDFVDSISIKAAFAALDR